MPNEFLAFKCDNHLEELSLCGAQLIIDFDRQSSYGVTPNLVFSVNRREDNR